MAELWAGVIIAFMLSAIAGLVVWRWHDRPGTVVFGLGIALVCGLAGALFIVRRRVDVVPDDTEPLIIAILISIVSLVLIFATWLQWLRR